jgi:release factor glutamine methyltransferase
LPGAPRIDPESVAFLRAAGCVYAEDEARILTESARSGAELETFLGRRAAGEPLEYVVGWAEFCGLRITVNHGVFVPRRRSEFLAECAIRAVSAAALVAGREPGPVKLLDMCCGSGAIGLAVAIRSDNVDVLACDSSSAAVECARQNLAPVCGRVYEGDLYGPLPGAEMNSVDLIVASAPYVPTKEIPRLPAEARLYEPASALDGGADGTRLQSRILVSAREWLREGGLVMMETAPSMSDLTAATAENSGFVVEVRRSPERDAAVIVATPSRIRTPR